MRTHYGSQSAFPFVNYLVHDREDNENEPGMTVLQLASLMIAPAVLERMPMTPRREVADFIVDLAVCILEAADDYYDTEKHIADLQKEQLCQPPPPSNASDADMPV